MVSEFFSTDEAYFNKEYFALSENGTQVTKISSQGYSRSCYGKLEIEINQSHTEYDIPYRNVFWRAKIKHLKKGILVFFFKGNHRHKQKILKKI